MFSLTIEETLRITKHSTLIDIETIEKASLMDKELIIFSPVRSNKHVIFSFLYSIYYILIQLSSSFLLKFITQLFYLFLQINILEYIKSITIFSYNGH